MKSLKRFFSTLLFFFLIAAQLFAINASPKQIAIMAQDLLIRYGNQYVFQSETRNLLKAMAEGQGGVLFRAVAAPEDASLSGQPVTLVYDGAQPDGSRLVISFGGEKIRDEGLYDWMLLPVAAFADTPYYNCVTLLGEPREQWEKDRVEFASKNRMPVGWAEYHPAFSDTLVGLNFYFVDAMLADISRNTINAMRNVTARMGVLAGYNDNESNAGYNRMMGIIGADHAFQITAATMAYLRQLSARKEQTGIMESPGSSGRALPSFTYIYSEPDTGITFRIEDGRIKFTGYPYYHFGIKTKGGEYEYAEEITRVVNAYPELVEGLNPAIFDTAGKTARWAAFFRFVKKEHPLAWKTFYKQLLDSKKIIEEHRPEADNDQPSYKRYRYDIDPAYYWETPRSLDFFNKDMEEAFEEFLKRKYPSSHGARPEPPSIRPPLSLLETPIEPPIRWKAPATLIKAAETFTMPPIIKTVALLEFELQRRESELQRRKFELLWRWRKSGIPWGRSKEAAELGMQRRELEIQRRELEIQRRVVAIRRHLDHISKKSHEIHEIQERVFAIQQSLDLMSKESRGFDEIQQSFIFYDMPGSIVSSGIQRILDSIKKRESEIQRIHLLVEESEKLLGVKKLERMDVLRLWF
jgi:hypothetical protein